MAGGVKRSAETEAKMLSEKFIGIFSLKLWLLWSALRALFYFSVPFHYLALRLVAFASRSGAFRAINFHHCHVKNHAIDNCSKLDRKFITQYFKLLRLLPRTLVAKKNSLLRFHRGIYILKLSSCVRVGREEGKKEAEEEARKIDSK